MSAAIMIDVTWKDRVLNSYGISRLGSVFVGGGNGADVIVPVLPAEARIELAKIRESGVCVTDPIKGDLYLQPGETAKITLKDELLFLRVRRIDRPTQAHPGTILDLSSTEALGVILAIAISGLLGLYMNIYAPRALVSEETPNTIPLTVAKIRFDKPVKAAPVAEVTPTPAAAPAQKKPSLRAQTEKVRKQSPGGILSAFGSNGISEALKKTFSDGNSLSDLAGSATGAAGRNTVGTPIGDLKATAAGRDGSTVGIDGVGTQGRNRGGTGYRTGGMEKRGTSISVSGTEAQFTEGMDREAIRRVIREHLREIRNCYERELQRQPDLYGKLVIHWDIEGGGRVSNASVHENSTGNNRVGDCLLSALRMWTFPEPPRNQIGRISYPFVFSSQ